MPRRPTISAEALALLEAYWWPGNVRELRHAVERAVLLADDGNIRPEHLPHEKLSMSRLHVRAPAAETAPQVPQPALVDSEFAGTPSETMIIEAHAAARGEAPSDPERDRLADELDRLERTRILEALEQSGGNQTRASERL